MGFSGTAVQIPRKIAHVTDDTPAAVVNISKKGIETDGRKEGPAGNEVWEDVKGMAGRNNGNGITAINRLTRFTS